MSPNLLNSENLSHVLRYSLDVAFQLYVFPTVSEDTLGQLKRRIVCRVFGTLATIVVVYHVHQAEAKDEAWMAVVALSIYVALQLHRTSRSKIQVEV